jgi:hypothetical protein
MSATFGVSCKNGLPRSDNNIMWLESQCELVTKQNPQGITLDRLWIESQRNGQLGINRSGASQGPGQGVSTLGPGQVVHGQNTSKPDGIGAPMCDDSPTNAPASCSNVDAPANGSKGAGWKDTLPSGESNAVVCQTGLAPTNEGKNTCLNGVLTPAFCLPAPCVDATKPTNGRRGAGWNELLSSGETNAIACDEGYEPTNGGLNVCNMGVLSTAMCMRKPNWVFRERESCGFPNGTDVAISMSTTDDVNQMVRDCKANCMTRQCNIATVDPSIRMCYLRFGKSNSGTPIDDQIVCVPNTDHSSWLLANKTYPTSPPCTTITPPTNGTNGPDCGASIKHGETCTQSCNPGFTPLGDSRKGMCQSGVFSPITCVPLPPPPPQSPPPQQPPPMELPTPPSQPPPPACPPRCLDISCSKYISTYGYCGDENDTDPTGMNWLEVARNGGPVIDCRSCSPPPPQSPPPQQPTPPQFVQPQPPLILPTPPVEPPQPLPQRRHLEPPPPHPTPPIEQPPPFPLQPPLEPSPNNGRCMPPPPDYDPADGTIYLCPGGVSEGERCPTTCKPGYEKAAGGDGGLDMDGLCMFGRLNGACFKMPNPTPNTSQMSPPPLPMPLQLPPVQQVGPQPPVVPALNQPPNTKRCMPPPPDATDGTIYNCPNGVEELETCEVTCKEGFGSLGGLTGLCMDGHIWTDCYKLGT